LSLSLLQKHQMDKFGAYFKRHLRNAWWVIAISWQIW